AANLASQHRQFAGCDLSTKLKLMGVDVASFGDYFADEKATRTITYEDPFQGIYKKLLFTTDGSRLVGGILVGDASDYGTLLMRFKSDEPLPVAPGELLLGKSDGKPGGAVGDMADQAQVCSCNNVSKGQIRAAVRDQGLTTV